MRVTAGWGLLPMEKVPCYVPVMADDAGTKDPFFDVAGSHQRSGTALGPSIPVVWHSAVDSLGEGFHDCNDYHYTKKEIESQACGYHVNRSHQGQSHRRIFAGQWFPTSAGGLEIHDWPAKRIH